MLATLEKPPFVVAKLQRAGPKKRSAVASEALQGTKTCMALTGNFQCCPRKFVGIKKCPCCMPITC
eukprot:167240-Karenia_brevis.AAC.1